MRIENLPEIEVPGGSSRSGAHRPDGARSADAGRTAGFRSIYSQPAGGWRPVSPADQAPPAAHVTQAQPWYEVSSQTPAPAPRPRIQRKHVIAAVCAVALVGAGVAIAAALGAFKATDGIEVPVADISTVQASVKVDNVLASYRELERGERLENVQEASELTGSYAGEYYRAELNGTTVYVEKKLVRTSEEAAPEEWTGYAAEDAAVFSGPDFSGKAAQQLQLNDEVAVLDSFCDMVFVRAAGGLEGYMPADKVMREKAEVAESEGAIASLSSSHGSGSSGGSVWSGSAGAGASGGASSGSTSGNAGMSGGAGTSDGGSGSGGSVGGGSGSGGSSEGGADGSDVDAGSSTIDGDEMLMPTSGSFSVGGLLLGTEMAYAAETSSGGSPAAARDGLLESDVSGTVLMDGAPAYLAILNRGDVVTVKVDGLFGFEGSLVPGASAQAQDVGLGEDADAGESLPVSDKAAAGSEGSDEADDLCTVLVNGQEVLLPEVILRLKGQAEYDPWTGFADEGATLFADYKLTMGPLETELNQELKVIDAVGTKILVVDIDGAAYCTDASLVAKERLGESDSDDSDGTDGSDELGSSNADQPSSYYGSSNGNWGGSGSWSGNGSWSGGGSSGGSSSGGSSSGSSSGGGSSGGSSSGGSSSDGSSSGGGSSDGSSGGSSGGDSSSEGDNSEVWTAPKL